MSEKLDKLAVHGFLECLEFERLNILRAIIDNESSYDLKDLEKLALHGSAIQSVKDAIKFQDELG